MGEQNRGFFYLLIGQFLSVLGERISTLVFFSIAVAKYISDSETKYLIDSFFAFFSQSGASPVLTMEHPKEEQDSNHNKKTTNFLNGILAPTNITPG